MRNFLTEEIRNVCILGNGNAGKTTVVESMLRFSGAIERRGSVLDGTTVSDYDAEEIKRKISINTSLVSFEFENCKYNILDTPGSFDFVGEALEAIEVADAAVIVVSGKSGVSAGVERAWELCEKRNLPRIFFVNKVDDERCNFQKVLEELREKFGKTVAPFQVPIDNGEKIIGFVDVVRMRARLFQADGPLLDDDIPDYMMDKVEPVRNMIIESVAETDEALMDRYFNGEEFTVDEIKKAIDAALFANYNCLRVWGGGYYPSEYFYDLCDEKGIIIWQDFMAACCEIRLTKEMLENIKEEAIYNLKRFRNHASFGMFCGNNEVEETYVAWEGVTTKLREFDYIELYEHILPDICREYIPETFYWPSSPHSKACLSDPSNYHKYEAHVWEVWGGNLPHECYRKHIVPFSSEYGFQSFPSVKTLKTVCSDKEMNMFSETMEHHQKSVGFGTGWKVMNYIARSYLYQTEFENIVYATQIEQAESIRIAVEHLRRNRGKCMGSLYWQINDCWPVISWSSVDYYGRYKALHYSAKKVYAPLLMVITDEKEKYTISISNEQMKEAEGTIKFGVYDNDFNEIETCSSKYSVSKLSAKDIATFDATKYLGRRDVYFAAECYDENGKLISRKIQLFVIPKHYGWKNPEISVRASDVDGGVIFKISAKYMAKSVFIDFNKYDVVLSDNNFDILAGGEIELFANTDIPVKELEKDIIIKSLNVLC